MRKLISNKKGNLPDILLVGAILFGSIITLIFIYHIWTQIKPELNTALEGAMPSGQTSFNVSLSNDNVSGGILTFNNMIGLFLVGWLIFILISAFFIGSHPAFFFMSIFFLLIVILVAVIFANVYQQVIEAPEISSSAADFTISNLFMEYLPFILTIAALLVMIILFAKPGGSGGSI